jgi:hypothetical protein
MKSDDIQIQELLALWAQYESDKDTTAWSELFAENARYIRPNGVAAEGRAAIKQLREERNARRPATQHTAHICGPSVIRVTGDTAESATDYIAYARPTADVPWNIVALGRLHTHLVRQSGRWYLQEMNNQAYFEGNPPPERLRGASNP